MRELTIIAAIAQNRVIGLENKLCWHLPEDLAHFRALTHGCTVIMGRKTWESLPAFVRPLPGRENIVVSRQTDYTAAGACVVGSLAAAVQQASCAKVFVIGGAQLYQEAMPLATHLELTEVALSPAGDTFFPEIDPAAWAGCPYEKAVSVSGIEYAFVRYVRT